MSPARFTFQFVTAQPDRFALQIAKACTFAATIVWVLF